MLKVANMWGNSGWVLAGMMAISLTGCEKNQAPTQAQGVPEVEVVTLTHQAVNLSTELPGRTVDFRQAEIRPQVSGILQKRLFEEGQMVEAGQVLYQIDPAPYQATLSAAKANLAKAEAVLRNAGLKAKRISNLLSTNAVSPQDYDDAQAAELQAKAELAAAKASLLSAQINLDYTRIVAPISGQIGRSAVTEGALLTANQAQGLATIRQLDPIYVDLTQSSTELMALKRQVQNGELQKGQGTQVSLILDDGSTYPFPGKLQFSEVNVDPGTGMVTIRAVFPNDSGELLPGMFVRAKVELGVEPQGLLIPQRALIRTPKGEASVMLVNAQNQVESRIVQVGRPVQQSWLAQGGIQTGERVIVAGLQKVRPGATVKVVDTTSPASATVAAGE